MSAGHSLAKAGRKPAFRTIYNRLDMAHLLWFWMHHTLGCARTQWVKLLMPSLLRGLATKIFREGEPGSQLLEFAVN
jgi:hypothetical protein